jgi:GDP-4-dehydro-6-deoxy-D-mannose reductase
MNQDLRILITGGTGFAGSHLVEALLKKGLTDIHVTNFSDTPSLVHQLLPADNIHTVDLADAEATAKLFYALQPNHVYHLAAYAAVGDSFQKTKAILENNLILQLNVLDAIKRHVADARTLVVGSAMEYDFSQVKAPTIDEQVPLGPVSPYAVSKVLQDLLGYSYARSYQLDIVRTRPFNHIGERQSPDFVVSAFAQQIVAIEKGQQDSLQVGNLEAVRDFTDVKDVVQAYITLMEKGLAGEVYNIGSGRGYTVRQILDMLIELAKVEITVQTDPNRLRPADVPITVANIDRIKQLGWQPTIDIKQTLQRVLEYWREQS